MKGDGFGLYVVKDGAKGRFSHTDQGLHVDLTYGCHGEEHQTSVCGGKGDEEGLGPTSCQTSNIKNALRLCSIQIDHLEKPLIFNVSQVIHQ